MTKNQRYGQYTDFGFKKLLGTEPNKDQAETCHSDSIALIEKGRQNNLAAFFKTLGLQAVTAPRVY